MQFQESGAEESAVPRNTTVLVSLADELAAAGAVAIGQESRVVRAARRAKEDTVERRRMRDSQRPFTADYRD